MLNLQKGLISQALLLLLLVAGIGLGTYLVQQRTNILPKAADNSFLCANDRNEATNKINLKGGAEICQAPGKPGLCGTRFLIYDQTNPNNDGQHFYCTWSACQPDSKGNFFDCSRPNEDKTAFPGGFLCTSDDYTDRGYRQIGVSQQICNRNGDPGCQGVQIAQFVKNSENVGLSWCKWSDCLPDPAKQCTPKAPTGQGGTGGQAVTGGCDPNFVQTECVQKQNKTGGCYINSAGNPVCLLGSNQLCGKNKDGKDLDQICKDEGLGGCKVIGGEPRCIYPQGIDNCVQQDDSACPGQCQVINRLGDRYSDCPKQCTDGWWNYCYVAFQKGCDNRTSDGVPICVGDPKPRNISPGSGGPAPATKTGASLAGGPTGDSPGVSSGQQTAAACTKQTCNYSEGADKCFQGTAVDPSKPAGFNVNCGYPKAADLGCFKQIDCKTAGNSSSASSDSTGIDPNASCGQDANGLDITCYKIGVFDEATLASTRADASKALANYQTYTKVLGEIKSYISEAVAQKAQAANNASQNAANACLR